VRSAKRGKSECARGMAASRASSGRWRSPFTQDRPAPSHASRWPGRISRTHEALDTEIAARAPPSHRTRGNTSRAALFPQGVPLLFPCRPCADIPEVGRAARWTQALASGGREGTGREPAEDFRSSELQACRLLRQAPDEPANGARSGRRARSSEEATVPQGRPDQRRRGLSASGGDVVVSVPRTGYRRSFERSLRRELRRLRLGLDLAWTRRSHEKSCTIDELCRSKDRCRGRAPIWRRGDVSRHARFIGLAGWHGPRLRSPRGAAIDSLRAGCEKRAQLAQRPKRAKNPGFAANPSSIHRLLVNVPLP
jgi:hypothetical protein